MAAAASAAIIANINIIGSVKPEISIIHFFIVLTTSPPAITAQANSKIAAITIAQKIVRAFDQTAGHTLLATSLAQMLIAIYPQTSAANNTKYLVSIGISKVNVNAPIINKNNKLIKYFILKK
jgi:hypothetical protein